jgi:hypothetical protein
MLISKQNRLSCEKKYQNNYTAGERIKKQIEIIRNDNMLSYLEILPLSVKKGAEAAKNVLFFIFYNSTSRRKYAEKEYK